MKSIFTLTLTLVFTFGLAIAMSSSITAQTYKKTKKGIALGFEKVKFNKKGKARTKTTLKPGSSVSYSIQRPKTGFCKIEVVWIDSNSKPTQGLHFDKIEWVIKDDGKTIKSGQLSSTNYFQNDNGNGYYTIIFTNISDKAAPLKLAWKSKTCTNGNLQEGTISKKKKKRRKNQ